MNGSRPAYLKGRGRGRGAIAVGRGVSPDARNGRYDGRPGRPGSGSDTVSNDSGSNRSSPRTPSSPVKAQKAQWASPEHHSQKLPAKNVEERFADVASRHQEAVHRHVTQADDICISSEEEEELDDTEILGSMLKSFQGSLGYDPGDIGSTGEYITNSVKSKASVCLICIETIKRNDPIWCCTGCYTMFHISCIQKWVKDGVYQQAALSDDAPSKDIPWNCPKCRHSYTQLQCPTRYFCFCGKEEDPSFDPWLVPHSCGQMCSKKLRPECGHSCLLLCHPGPCPPCPQTVRVPCYCRKQAPQIRRCGAKEWSCEQSCDRKLNCGHHTCQARCHPGECPPCPYTSTQACNCGAEEVERPCASPEWQCEKVCSRELGCGHHRCEIVCHAGDCGPCPRSGNRSCPCTKTKTDLPCTEDVPTCLETCEKILECGRHECTQRCHTGPCGTCREMTLKTCRCGSKRKELQCYKSYLCETKCSSFKDCSKHQCKRKCCDSNCPPCELQCNKSLGCRNHKCSSRCHRGPCYPCPESVTLKCHCGNTKVTVPCGREKVTRPPRCNLACRVAPDCHHPSRLKHRCHAGRCPPCQQMCGKQLDKCPHSCPARCHTGVFTTIKQKVERAGPWEAAPEVRQELVDHPCPPCRVPVPVTCLGKHETANMPCSVARIASCGRPCGRLLACSNHQCSLECHELHGAPDDTSAAENCEVCEDVCSKPRPEGCSHTCLQPCHGGECPACEQLIRMRCHCHVMLKHIECDQWTHADDRERDRLKSCGCQCPKTLSCGHQCNVLCHPGACPSPGRCVEKVKVRCPCKRKRAEFLCNEVYIGDAAVECDDVCETQKEAKKKEKEEAEKQKEEEKLRKQKQELEEFERKMAGKKRKKRKPRQEEEQPSALAKYAKYIIAPTLVVIMAVFIYYLIEVSKG